MRPSLALLASLLVVAADACGGTGEVTGSTPRPSQNAPPTGIAVATAPSHAARFGSYLKNDGDKDSDDARHPMNAPNDDQVLFATYGKKASPADARAVTSLVKRYYTAAAAGDGATACSLLHSSIATGLAASRSQAGQGVRDTCATSMSLLLKQQHQHLIAEDAATMVVTRVLTKGDIGLAMLGFRTVPESQIVIEREGHTWKVDALFDSYVT
jgi:hypothetical protein